MLRILAVVGARPQFIKHAVVQQQLQAQAGCRVLTLHTGQHYDPLMSAAFFEELHIPAPDYLLDTAGAAGTGAQIGLMMEGIEAAITAALPDAVLLYGDTNSTLAGAIVAARMRIPSIHVEAGVRSYNRDMPEEVNRIIADTFATLLFCPVPEAVAHLNREGIRHAGVHLAGDVMCDMLEIARPQLQPASDSPYYFATIHRPYNTDDPTRMRRILDTLAGLPHPVIFPIHPRTLGRVLGGGLRVADYPAIQFTAPVGYLRCLSYQAGAECVLTDSGGIQKEAYMLRKKCITLRSETEWNETLAHGWNTLVFEDIESIARLVHGTPGEWAPHMFGDGHAAAVIARIIVRHFEKEAGD